MKRCLVLLFLNGTIVFSFGQQLPDSTSYKIKIQRTTVPIKVDGILNEDVWKTADVATDFWEIILRDKEKAKRKTEFRLAFDDDFLYVSTYCEDTRPYISNTLKRDINGNLSDDIWIAIDPLKQKTNGFVFFLTAMNVQGDGAYSMNTLRNIAFSWDAKWYSAVKHHENYWTSEIAIPFKSFNYSADKKEWGINFYRVDMKNGQYSGWTKIPININWNDFGFFGSLIWDEDPPPSKKNIAIIPYSSGSSLRNNQITAPAAKNLSAGLDTKIGITPSLNLNLTLNPDFSQVEVDQQITNLTRFNIFFPERRNFFLENADLFSDWGAQVYNDGGLQGINPFYSRTIGLDQSGNPITILGGARVTGNINQDWRVGLMNIQTQRKGTFAAQNYTAATVKRQLLKRSTIGGYFFNRQAFQNETEKASNPLNAFGRNAGMETRFISNSAKWKAYSGYHISSKPGIINENHFVNIGGEFSSNRVGILTYFNDVGTNYYTDMGFIGRISNYDAKNDTIIRLGFKEFFNHFEYRITPGKGKVNSHLFGFENQIISNPNGTLNDRLNRFRYFINFRNRSELRFRADRQDTRLLYYTSFRNKEPLPPAGYVYHQWNIEYKSDVRKPFTYTLNYRQGQFYSGTIFSMSTSVNYRFKHLANLSVGFNYNKLNFPDPYGNAELILVNPRVEIYFSNNIFWTTFFQYNTQINNFNINSRFQWRYKPMSDFFLVYTDNYFSEPFLKNKNRAIIFKATYWFNL